MAVGDYTYGTVAGIQEKAGWVVASRTFSGTTIPTDTQVEDWLDQIAAEIHAKLAEAGYPIQTKANVTTNAPRAVKWLENLNEAGVCAEIIMSYAVAGDPEANENPSGYWKAKYKNGLKMIAGTFLHHLGLSKERDSSDLLVCTSVLDEDGNEKHPLFKRDMFDYPGARSIVEEDDD